MAQHTKVCPECPFNRKVAPNALGGSTPETYVGQVFFPAFWLPCHCACDFGDPNWRTNFDTAQCVGTATFRANVGVKPAPRLLAMAPNVVDVFAGPEEFLMHHKQISREEADAILRATPPQALVRAELVRSGVTLVVRKGE